MSRIKALFRPNFNIKHPFNAVALFLVLTASFFFALPVYAYEDDGTWVDGSFWFASAWNQTFSGPTKDQVCSGLKQYNPNYFSGNPSCSGVSMNLYTCAVDGDYYDHTLVTSYGSTQCGIPPVPTQPQNCTEFKSQNSDPISMTFSSGYRMEGCFDGCKVVDSGGVSLIGVDGDYTGNYQLTGGDCNGGYQAGLGAQEIIDFYAHDAELQNCYDSTGKLIGQISTALSCPTLDICYDVSTGNAVGTTSQSTSCSTGVKYNDLDQAVKNENVAVSESETLNPDGSSEVVKDTVTTQTGLDGSTESTIETTTTNKDSSGTTTSEVTKMRKELSSGSDYCDVKPNDPLCKLVKDNSTASLSGNCDTPPTCSGDPVGCASVRLQWEKFCADQSATESDFESWRTDSATVTKYGVDVDSNGVLTSLGKGEIDVQDTLGLSSLGDTGSAGSCPSPIDLGLLGAVIPFSFDTICDYATAARPLVIFASLYLCMVMVRRSLLGA